MADTQGTRSISTTPPNEAASVICPHCWHGFRPSETLAIARHTSLGNDRVFTGGAVRFLPSRFNAAGNPIDPAGEECTEFACPRCHLTISRSNLTAKPVFTSLIGGSMSGKSLLLAAATWSLRRVLPSAGWSFTDASPVDNRIIHATEQRMFLPSDPDAPFAFTTDPARGSDRHSVVTIGGKEEQLLRPFQFHVKPMTHSGRSERLLALYDNPGEDFTPGSQKGFVATRHLGRSKVLIFVLDLLADPRLRSICRKDHPLVKRWPASSGYDESWPRPELLLSEVASRAMGLKGVRSIDKIGARVIVVIAKADLCPDLYALIEQTSCVSPPPNVGPALGAIRGVSASARSIIESKCPEFVSTVRAIDPKADYIPVSVLRPMAPGQPDEGGLFQVRGRDVRSCWAEAPFLCALDAAFGDRVDGSNGSGGGTR